MDELTRTALLRNVRDALDEDIGDMDLTAELVDHPAPARAILKVREPCVFCGRPWFDETLSHVAPRLHVDWQTQEGDVMRAQDIVCEISGPARSLLTAERTALNFLQLLLAVATTTRALVQMSLAPECAC